MATSAPALYLPRRHQRRLLLPPGLLALAGLLWLGRLHISQDSRLQPIPAIQLTASPLDIPS